MCDHLKRRREKKEARQPVEHVEWAKERNSRLDTTSQIDCFGQSDTFMYRVNWGIVRTTGTKMLILDPLKRAVSAGTSVTNQVR